MSVHILMDDTKQLLISHLNKHFSLSVSISNFNNLLRGCNLIIKPRGTQKTLGETPSIRL